MQGKQSLKLPFTPYARLLTMIGDQLIKDEKVALGELIKNAYDADATQVKVSFDGFDNNGDVLPGASITIEDNGIGMSRGLIETAWMAPASPNKLKRTAEERITKEKHRVMQGEKGIGRFAMLKLGSLIEMTTRESGRPEEFHVMFDFSQYGEEFSGDDQLKMFPLLSDIYATLTETHPREIVKDVGFRDEPNIRGTKIRITKLKRENWPKQLISEIQQDIAYMQPIFSEAVGRIDSQDFSVSFYFNGIPQENHTEERIKTLQYLLAEKSVVKISNGQYDANKKEYVFDLNGTKECRSFDSLRHYATPKSVYKDKTVYPKCGSYGFSFYIFDRKVDREDQRTSKYWLIGDEPDIIANHRIYLYRDGIRVYPYGNADDDWLQIDALRGTFRASAYPSNDQIVGCIDITHEGNPALRDKTSREGLVDNGSAVRDFIESIQLFLQFLRREPYDRYRQDVRRRKESRNKKKEKSMPILAELKTAIKESNNPNLQEKVRRLETALTTEREIIDSREKTLEDLAGVGMSIETATHDLLVMSNRANDFLGELQFYAGMGGERCKLCSEKIDAARGAVAFVEQRVKDMQPLFRSYKQRTKKRQIAEILSKVMKFYNIVFSLPDVKIKCEIKEIAPLEVESTEAAMMQVLINLLDNSLYWLKHRVGDSDERRILIVIDGYRKLMLFSDNGDGVSETNADYVFEPFFSTKPQGRGLGLYIAKQLLGRQNYSICLAPKSENVLRGAAFLLDFSGEEKEV